MSVLLTKIVKIAEPSRNLLAEPAQALRDGALVAFPTETVYGLGAVYNNEAALLRIFAVKGRPADNPLIVHIASLEQLTGLVNEVSPKAELLIKAFWPGPLTLVFPKKNSVPDLVTAQLTTVAVRMPSHPVALELLRLTGVPIAAPSANLSGQPSPTQAEHVIEDLNGKIEFIIDAGSSTAGLESTVLSLNDRTPLILRPGTVTKEMIETVLGEPVEMADLSLVDRPQAPGMKYRHYAPKAKVILVTGDGAKVIAEIKRQLADLTAGTKVAVMAATENLSAYQAEWVWDFGSKAKPEEAAARLYELLRFSDRLKADLILIEGVTPQGIGTAVMNRLNKAAGGNVIHVS